MSAGRCKKGFLYDSYSSDSNANCVGVTSKVYTKDTSESTSACNNFYGSDVPAGAKYCSWSFRSFIKVLRQGKRLNNITADINRFCILI